MHNLRSFAGHTPSLGRDVYLDATAQVIGDVVIGDYSSLWPQAVVRGDVHRIRIGRRSNLQDGSILHVSHDSRFHRGGADLVVGDGVTVGHRAVLHGCHIGDYCLIGMGAVVLDHAVLPERVMLGAATLVAGGEVLESGFLYVGTPARRMRPLTAAELDYLEYSAEHYVRLATRHRRGGVVT